MAGNGIIWLNALTATCNSSRFLINKEEDHEEKKEIHALRQNSC